ncbi:hypothetical protein ACWNX6_00190 [Candidatus Vidania fulgoroideorum]
MKKKKKDNNNRKKKKKTIVYVSNNDSKFQYSFIRNKKNPIKIRKFDPKTNQYVFFYEKKK